MIISTNVFLILIFKSLLNKLKIKAKSEPDVTPFSNLSLLSLGLNQLGTVYFPKIFLFFLFIICIFYRKQTSKYWLGIDNLNKLTLLCLFGQNKHTKNACTQGLTVASSIYELTVLTTNAS